MADEFGDVVLTEAGPLTPEELAVREQLGTAAPVVQQRALLGEGAERLREESAPGPLEVALKEAATAATLGLVIPGGTGMEAREERARGLQYNPLAATAGQVAGAVLPGLLSGGTGIIGTAARLTPAGKLAAISARIAGQGSLGRAALGGALEAGVGAVGDYVARVRLEEDPEFSAEALAASLLGGATLGAVAGAGGELVGRGLGAAARRAEREAAAEVSPVLGTVGPGAKKGQWSSYDRVVRKQLGDDVDALRALGSKVDDVAAKSTREEITALRASKSYELAAPEARALADQAATLADDVDALAVQARKSWRVYADDVGLDKAAKRVTRDATEEVENALVTDLVALDQATSAYHRVAEEAHAQLGAARLWQTPQAAASAAKLSADLGAAADKAGLLGRAGEVATSALGAAELASMAGVDTGLPSVSQIPVVGEVLGAYLKYKGVTAAARGAGLLRSRATRAAEAVGDAEQSLRSRLAATTKRGLVAAAKRVSASAQTRVAPAAMAAKLVDLRAATPEEVGGRVYDELADVDTAIAQAAAASAARAHQYLQDVAPRDPVALRTPTMGRWAPTQQEVADFTRRERAATQPAAVIGDLLATPQRTLEIQTLDQLYPALMARYRNDLMESVERLAGTLEPDALRALGLDLGLPLSIASNPNYPPPTMGEGVAHGGAQPGALKLPGPSTPGASPAVTLESVDPGPRS